MKSLFRWGFVTIAALLIIGCTQPPEPRLEPVDLNPRVDLLLSREGLARDISFVDTKLRTEGRFPQLQFAIGNQSTSRYTLEYKVDWFDQEGFSSRNGDGSWQRFTLSPGQQEVFTSTGRAPEAFRARVQLRLPSDVFMFGDAEND